jgi:5-hydroxyisourate hydrolase-like protein (transthyretin family)
LISKTYEPQPGETISDVELVLDKGFAGRVRFVDGKGEPIAETKLSGTYFMPERNGWTGLNTIDEVVSGEDGIAVIEHCIERTAKLSARADGYQEDSNRDVSLKPGEVFVWELTEAKPTTGVVLSRTSGEPVAGAELRLCRKDKSDHRWSFGGSSRIVLAHTNDEGEFVLGSLDNQWEYTFIVAAQNYNSTILKGVKMGDEGLKVELGPELYLSGKVIGDVNELGRLSGRPIVRWESNYHSVEHGVYDNGSIDVEVADGAGHFVIRNILGDYLTIRAGDKTRQVEIGDEPIDDFVIDLRPQAEALEENIREVVLEFDVPQGDPLPEGELRINTNSQENHAKKIGGTSDMYPIEDGRIRLEVPVPGRVSYDLNRSQSPRIAGYWIERKSGINVPAGDTPFVLSVLAHPAGAIYGQVLEADGTLANDIRLHMMVLEKAPVMEGVFSLSHVFNYAQKELGKFNASPLPFGGKYVVLAYRDSTFAASEPITLDEGNPIRQIDIRFAEGRSVSGRVTAPDGKPFADAAVTLTASVRFGEGPSWGTGAGRVTTGPDGRFAFEHVNAKLPGRYELRVEAGPGYQRVQMEITPSSRPVNIELEQGHGLSGILLDDATGWPIPDAQIWAEALRKTGRAGDHAQADAKTDEAGRFQFSTLARREYRLYLAGAEIVSPTRMEAVTGGQPEQVTLRVKLHEWCDLAPCEHVVEHR